MKKIIENIFGKKVENTRVIPVTLKIVFIFTLFILISNFASNYINLMYNRNALLGQMRQLLAKDLKDAYTFCNTQHEIYHYSKDLESSLKSIDQKGLHDFKNKKSILLGIKADGSFLFQASRIKKYNSFTDIKTLDKFNEDIKKDKDGDFIHFTFNNEEYLGIYKYNIKWDIYILRAEELNEFHQESRTIFRNIAIIIFIITVFCSIVGILVLKFILRFIGSITSDIMHMVEGQQLELIDLKGAPNDDITYLGVAFNSLSTTINTLVTIFRKFVNEDIAIKAYQEKEIRLEGTQKNLTILFSDIKSFTFITETLGHDIIKLLNLHYDRSIREIVKHEGTIGAIIGDALLAVYGSLEDSMENKSYQAVVSAYKLQDVAKSLRESMLKKRDQVEAREGKLTKEEDKVYKAVLLHIGVGIDGGEVFYGTLGSYVRMTNTVIGDNVNAASRLEGLTRVYRVPVICSDFVKDDIEKHREGHGFRFIEIDMVMVKGKTKGKRVYWPLLEKDLNKATDKHLDNFSKGLELYYNGDWKEAYKYFIKCKLSLAQVFRERTKSKKSPPRWNGIWEMKTK